MKTKLIRTPGLYLVGFMGSGKSTVGELLADELGWNFVDLDDDIEAVAQKPIWQIFDEDGESEFRRREHNALAYRVKTVQRGEPLVVALGGGAYAQENNFELVRDNGITFWLDAPLERIRLRIQDQHHRPLARDPEKFEALYQSRRECYSRADYRIEVVSDDPRAALASIMSLSLF